MRSFMQRQSQCSDHFSRQLLTQLGLRGRVSWNRCFRITIYTDKTRIRSRCRASLATASANVLPSGGSRREGFRGWPEKQISLHDVQPYCPTASANDCIVLSRRVRRACPSLQCFYARQLYRQVLLRARISYGNSVCPSVCLSVRHDPVVYQAQVR